MLTPNDAHPEKTIVTQLRAYLAQTDLPEDGRLPPERELSAALGVSRTELRKALDVLESEGQLWRHVGKGTFVGSRPLDTFADIAALARRSNPAEVMRARLVIEPEIARAAAFTATPASISEMRLCLSRSRQAETWRQYEGWDTRLHRTIAEATQNSLLVGLFDTLNAVRRAVTWGRLRTAPVRPLPSHHSFVEHETLVDAIEHRDMAGAAIAMRAHLHSVERKLLEKQMRAANEG
ncbi:FadR/GntR family transcriptional regulator [Ancylobacter pratisalsi]|uniref:FadR family transcriptional regulator n=1 Tax=Ancylobacter pratisalsi TaxID=1745854 RepID=A0A6P1YXR6_9HYPH|nr:FCD domain-containing protein [Ancylobacter pratisalsi]QIB36354.1 FadR family transcriptional regulator [Ancylobacter pratisalsi]